MECSKICSYKLIDIDVENMFGKLIYVRPIYTDKSNLHYTISNILETFEIPENDIAGFEIYNGFAYILYKRNVDTKGFQIKKYKDIIIQKASKNKIFFDNYYIPNKKLRKYVESLNVPDRYVKLVYDCVQIALIKDIYNYPLPDKYIVCHICKQNKVDILTNCSCDIPKSCIYCVLKEIVNGNICKFCKDSFEPKVFNKIKPINYVEI